MSASPRSLASRLTTRLFAIAGAALVVNMLAVGLYYGFDRRAMEGEVVEHRLGLVSEAFDPAEGRVEASARAIAESSTAITWPFLTACPSSTRTSTTRPVTSAAIVARARATT